MKKFAILSLVLLVTACGPEPVKHLIPMDTAYQGAAKVENIKITYHASVVKKLKANDTKIVAKTEAKKAKVAKTGKAVAIDYSNMSLEESFSSIFKDRMKKWPNQTMPVDMSIEITNLKMAGGAAIILIGGIDQLSGVVVIKDKATQKTISTFSVDVMDSNGGLLGLAIRGAGVREKLITKFVKFIELELYGKV